jgi:Eukaryotic aspartyl protease
LYLGSLAPQLQNDTAIPTARLAVPNQTFVQVTHIEDFLSCAGEEGVIGFGFSEKSTTTFASLLSNLKDKLKNPMFSLYIRPDVDDYPELDAGYENDDVYSAITGDDEEPGDSDDKQGDDGNRRLLDQDSDPNGDDGGGDDDEFDDSDDGMGKATGDEGVDEILNNVFGINIDEPFGEAYATSFDSELVLGGVHFAHYRGCLTWHDVGQFALQRDTTSYRGYWDFALDGGATSNDQALPSSTMAVVDSGSTELVGPTEAIQVLSEINAFSCFNIDLLGEPEMVDCSNDKGFDLAAIECNNTDFAPIEFNSEGTTYRVTRSDLVVEVDEDDEDPLCMIHIDGDADLKGWILGDPFLSSHYAAFDFDKRRVGFAPISSGDDFACPADWKYDVTNLGSGTPAPPPPPPTPKPVPRPPTKPRTSPPTAKPKSGHVGSSPTAVGNSNSSEAASNNAQWSTPQMVIAAIGGGVIVALSIALVSLAVQGGRRRRRGRGGGTYQPAVTHVDFDRDENLHTGDFEMT